MYSDFLSGLTQALQHRQNASGVHLPEDEDKEIISVTGKKWQRRPPAAPGTYGKLKSEFQTSKVLLKLLAQRGVSGLQEAYNYFLPTLDALHSPFLLKDVDVAVERIHKAVNEGETIVVYGDYDVDGTTSVALIYSFLHRFHKNILYYIPDRFTEGYGITVQGIDWAKSHNVSLIISLDCGIKSSAQISYAKELGIDFIVCDHHTVGDTLPDAVAVINPKRPDDTYPYKELSGCGIGYKLAEAYAAKYYLRWEPAAYLDLVAISIAADLVPMTGENRVMTYHGLQKLNSNPRPGIKAIMRISGIKNKLDVTDLVFRIGPRINAAGRVSSGTLAVQMLVEQSESAAAEIAETINQKNADRQTVDQSTTRQALSMMKNPELKARRSTVLFGADWHQGVIGIVASRLIEKYHKPTVLLTSSNGQAVGSARSVPGFDLYKALQKCEDLLDQWGGHRAAAGLTMPLDNIEAFTSRFEQVVQDTILEEMLTPILEYDFEIELTDISLGFAKNIAAFGPFGPENPKPVFVVKRLSYYDEPQIISQKHLRCTVVDEQGNITRMVAYGMAAAAEKIRNKIFDACFTVELSDYRGMAFPMLSVKDFRINTATE